MSYGYLSQMLEYLTGAYARSDIRNSRHSLPMETNIGRLFGTLAWGLEIIHENADRLKLWDDIDNARGSVLDRYTALGKVMAGSGGIQFTKAELDSGDLPEGTVVEDLTAPIEYAGDAMIAKCENTGTGEATVVVQATSVGVETGFYVKGVMLYIKDPEGEGDVAYSYLPLQSKPEWMRPQGSPVNKMVTFNIINIVGAAASVSAIIDPDALARVVDLEKYALLGHSHEISDVSGLSNTLSDHAAAIDLLNDLVSGDMPGGINKTADFATLAGITMRDGVWSQTGRSITA